MKTIFSKTLICGVIASSFILVNCQKSPTRKVTPGKTQTGTPVAGKTTEQEVLLLAKCSPEFETHYKELIELQKSITEDIKKEQELTESRKEVIKDHSKKLNDKFKTVSEEIKKLKVENHRSQDRTATVNACYRIVDGKKSEPYRLSSIEKIVTDLDKELAKLSGAPSERVTAANEAEKAKTKKESDLESQPTYVASEKFDEALEAEQPVSGKYFMSGKIEERDFEANLAHKEKSLCYIFLSEGSIKTEKVLLRVMKISDKTTMNDKQIFSVTLGSGDKFFELKCSFIKGKSISDEFRKVMGDHLLTEKEISVRNPTKPTETKPAEAASLPEPVTEATPADQKPVAAKPVEQKPAEAKPASATAQAAAAAAQPKVAEKKVMTHSDLLRWERQQEAKARDEEAKKAAEEKDAEERAKADAGVQ